MLDKLSPGDFPPNSFEKPGYILEFCDEFDGPGIDTDKWFPFYGSPVFNGKQGRKRPKRANERN
jgi:hypothetical protein